VVKENETNHGTASLFDCFRKKERERKNQKKRKKNEKGLLFLPPGRGLSRLSPEKYYRPLLGKMG